MTTQPGFVHARRKSLRDGYGNRVVTTCTGCGAIVADLDPGNGPGLSYAKYWRQKAMNDHRCAAAS